MLRDVTATPTPHCTECASAKVAPYKPGSILMSVMCTHPTSIAANGGVIWAASIARDTVCRGEWFARVQSKGDAR